MKIFKKIAIFLILLIVIVVLARNIIFKVAIERGVQAITGLPLRMEKLDIDLIKTRIQITGLNINNPKEFPDRVMLNMPEIFVDYELFAFLKKKVYLNEVRIDLREFTVVKNKDGAVNLDALKNLQTKKKTEEPKKAEQPKTPPPELKIGLLELKVGKVISKDYSKGGEPSVQEFNINLDEKYENIENVGALVSLIVFKALANTTVGSLLNFDLGFVGDAVSGTVSGATDVATGALKSTTGFLKKTTQGLGDVIKAPLGSEQ